MDLYWAAWDGETKEVRLLLNNGANVNAQGGEFGNALQAAIFKEEIEVVRLLLNHGADVNAQGGYYGTALQAAALRKIEIVRLLLDKNADVNTQGGYYGNALLAAAIVGDTEIVRLLLDKNADVNAQGGEHGNALQAAACQGTIEIVQLLLDKRADVNAQGGEYGNALQAAAYEGRAEVARILLNHGADVNAQGGYYGTALQAATLGNTEIVQLLLDKRADVNAQGGYYGNALQAAASGGKTEVVRLLLNHGADVNAQGGYYGTALQAAALRKVEIVRVLLDKNADVNAQGGYYGNALQAAIYGEETDIVRLLLDKNADVNAQGGYYGTALQAAALGKIEIVRLLLDNNADVNTQGGYYGTALQAAVLGEVEIVRLLLDKNADVNAQGGYYGTALQAAALGTIEIVRLLLDKNADVNAQGGEYGHVLHAAIWSGNLDILNILLEKQFSVNTNIQDASGRMPLHIAVEVRSPPAIVQLLERGAQTNEQDFRGATPLQFAVEKGDHESALLLLPKSADSLCFVEASTWRYLLPGSEPHLEMVNCPATTLKKRLEIDLRNRRYPFSDEITELDAKDNNFMETDINSRRIFILADGFLFSPSSTSFRCRWWRRVQKMARIGQRSYTYGRKLNWVWRVQSDTAPSLATLTQIPTKDCFVECCFTTRAVTLPISTDSNWPRLSDTFEFDIQQFEKTYGIQWIMTKRQGSSVAGSTLESRVFFSTSEYAQVPPSAAALFAPLVQQLQEEWNQTLRAADNRLANMRTELLRANGSNPLLIRDLLGDAQLWDLLRRTCRKQIADLKEFQTSYESKPWEILREHDAAVDQQKNEEFLKEFSNGVVVLEKAYNEGLDTLLNTSQDLIQLEFNLTSIAEAQKSTSTNKSMKRLSWITFVFLPLMFIASLFGMNIDVLASNPPWWLYIPFAVVTVSLTLVVWLIFKYSNLGDSIEDIFSRHATRQTHQDLEKGLRRSLLPHRKTAMFSAFGKKRS